MSRCRVCSRESDKAATMEVPELMIGTNEIFKYTLCPYCGSLSIVDIPDNLDWYYSQNYYSHQTAESLASKSLLKSRLRIHSMRGKIGSANLIDRIAAHVRPVHFHWMLPKIMSLDSRIVDVGCGSGRLVHEMADYGFSDLTGIDPFLSADMEDSTGHPRLLHCSMEDLCGEHEHFDVVMLHHVFEHLHDAKAGLLAARQLLSPNGRILIRVPVANSFAFRKYGRYWVQIDAPRHIFVPTVDGIYNLAKNAGLIIERCFYDSNGFQFLGSEAYLRGIRLCDAEGLFSEPERKSFHQLALSLNSIHDGDSACFWLRAKD